MAVNLQHTIQEQLRVLSEEEMRQVLSFVTALQKRKKAAPVRPLSAIFEDLSNEIPLEQWQEIPADGAENHDHYLYGAPKQTSLRKRTPNERGVKLLKRDFEYEENEPLS